MIQIETNCPQCKRNVACLIPIDGNAKLSCQYCGCVIGHTTPVQGFLYALKNKSMPGLLKIGFTTRPVEERVAELDASTATPTPFEIVFYFACTEPQSDEAVAHSSLNEHRINQSREFFAIEEREALVVLRGKLARNEVFLAEYGRNEACTNELHLLDEALRTQLARLRNIWLSPDGSTKAVSLVYTLMSEGRHQQAKVIVEAFLKDMPKHIVAIRQREQIDVVLSQRQ